MVKKNSSLNPDSDTALHYGPRIVFDFSEIQSVIGRAHYRGSLSVGRTRGLQEFS